MASWGDVKSSLLCPKEGTAVKPATTAMKPFYSGQMQSLKASGLKQGSSELAGYGLPSLCCPAALASSYLFLPSGLQELGLAGGLSIPAPQRSNGLTQLPGSPGLSSLLLFVAVSLAKLHLTYVPAV